MGDAAIQGRIQTLIQGLTTFADADVVLGDYQVIGRGNAPYAIVVPGPFTSRRSGNWSQVTYSWTHYVEVWEAFAADSFSNITTARQDVVDVINENPTLDGLSGVSFALAEASDEMMFLWRKGQSRETKPAFVGFRIRIATIEEVLYAGGGEFT